MSLNVNKGDISMKVAVDTTSIDNAIEKLDVLLEKFKACEVYMDKLEALQRRAMAAPIVDNIAINTTISPLDKPVNKLVNNAARERISNE